MADDNFFKEEPVEENQEEIVEKVKVGDKEFTQDELNKLVNLGEIAIEAEEKYNRPISKFWPEYTKQNQELEKLREENEKLKVASTPQAPAKEGELTEEQTKEQVRTEMSKYGYVPADDVRKIANEVVSGYRLLDQVGQVVAKQAIDGTPQTTQEELLEYMSEKNINDPELAYKIKFEKELDSIKEKKLASLKPSGFVTEATSTAGSKQPLPTKITKDNLQDTISN